MSELFGGGPAARNGGARGISGPIPVPQAPASGVRTPTDIMRLRQAREQRKREEAEQAELERQQRFQEEERRKSAERRALAAGVTGQRDSGYRSQGISSIGGRTPGQPGYTSPNMSAQPALPMQATLQSYPRRDASGASYQEMQDPPVAAARTASGRARTTTVSQDKPRAVSQPLPQQSPQPASARAQPAQPAQPSSKPAQADPGASYPEDNGPARSGSSSFPHAFERWETLSSHWEGLTSYWIRRMEQNNEQIRRDPIAQQMSRQITDLSAAGANLFHAVVELQRLRASSERKFQRWFFETRAEQERARETQATLQAALDAERAGRQEDTRAQQEDVRSRQLSMDADRRMNEMKRELQISKDEARRAWEELGRREQLERDRIFSLREGHGIIIGDIQVLPQGLVSRGPSLQRPATHETGGYSAPPTSAGVPTTAREVEYQQAPSPTETDPFSHGGQPPQSIPAQSSRHAQAEEGEEEPFDDLSPPQQFPTSTSPASAGLAAMAGSPAPRDLGASTTPTQVPPNLSTDPAKFYRQGANTYLESAGVPAQPQSQSHPQRPSTAGGRASEEESDDGGYALDDQGNVVRDERGVPVPFHSTFSRARGGIQGQVRPGPAPIRDITNQAGTSTTGTRHRRKQDSDDEFDVAEDIERERIRAAAYGRSDSSRQLPARATGASGRGGLPPANYEGQGWGDDDDFTPDPDPLHDPLDAHQREVERAHEPANPDRLRTHAELENERILHEEQLARQRGHAQGDEDLDMIDDDDWDPSEQSGAAGGGQRHHHPTRLSDVLEEDELSRASRQSRGSHDF